MNDRPDGRRHGEHVAATVAHERQAAQDDGAHARRDLDAAVDRDTRVGKAALVGEQPHQLDDEERIAARAPVQSLGRRRGHRPAAAQLADEVGHLARA